MDHAIADHPERTSARTDHYLVLDGFRGIAALSVLLLHWFDGHGQNVFGSSLLAVDFFFMLSGFVIAYSYEDRLRAGYGQRQFIVARLIRIYPLILIGISLGYLRAIASAMASDESLAGLEPLGFAASLLLLPQQVSSLDLMFPQNHPLWSLHFEFAAYLAFAVLLFRLPQSVLTAICVVAFPGVWLWASMRFGPASADHSAAGYLLGLARIAFSFSLGIMLCRFVRRTDISRLSGGIWLAIPAFAIMALPRDLLPVWATVPILLLAFPCVIAAGTQVRLSPGGSRIAKALGDLSYPLYVVHVPVIWILGGVMKKVVPLHAGAGIWMGIIVLPATIVFAYAVFYLYDQPLRRWLKGRMSNSAGKADTVIARPALPDRLP